MTSREMEQLTTKLSAKEGFASSIPGWKRALDLTLLLLTLPGLLLTGALVALLIKLCSRGPIFFRQTRVGYKGRDFICFKFRTMAVNADTESHRRHTQKLIKSQACMVKLDERKDPRLIPFGSGLRACGLDELPQLINVLRGEMSLVGPRPCIRYECEAYEPWHWQRFDAVPGLTGLWQVSGKNRTTFDQMVQLDIDYCKRMSLWLDLKIIARTLPALWRQCSDLQTEASAGDVPHQQCPSNPLVD
jgi:lipopolysaccharide/colanic/teichoic acid biosynthesis glycosyltransferase